MIPSLLSILTAVLASALQVLAAAERNAGDSCDSKNEDELLLRDPSDSQWFLFCDANGQYAREKCPEGQSFDYQYQSCLKPARLPQTEKSTGAENVSYRNMQIQPPRANQVEAKPTVANSACPAGLSLYAPDNVPQICNLQMRNCPAGYTCMLVQSEGNFRTYCCGGGANNGQGAEPTFGPGSQIPVAPRPVGSRQVFDDGSAVPILSSPVMIPSAPPAVGLPAQSQGPPNVCPRGYSQLYEFGTPKTCNPLTGIACPQGYLCVSSSSATTGANASVQYNCCGKQQAAAPIGSQQQPSFAPSGNIQQIQFQSPAIGASAILPAFCANGLPAIGRCETNLHCGSGQQCLGGLCCVTMPSGSCASGYINTMGQCKKLTCSLRD